VQQEEGDSRVRIPRPRPAINSHSLTIIVRKIKEKWAGQDLNSRSPPCQGITDDNHTLLYSPRNRNSDGVGQEFESPPPLTIDWQQFYNFLLQRMTAKTAEDRLRYAKKYTSILTSVRITTELLQLPPNKRIHIMKALSSVARFTGRSELWRQTRQKYGLQLSTGTEKIDAFTRFSMIPNPLIS
jgi:hypothetical protein